MEENTKFPCENENKTSQTGGQKNHNNHTFDPISAACFNAAIYYQQTEAFLNLTSSCEHILRQLESINSTLISFAKAVDDISKHLNQKNTSTTLPKEPLTPTITKELLDSTEPPTTEPLNSVKLKELFSSFDPNSLDNIYDLTRNKKDILSPDEIKDIINNILNLRIEHQSLEDKLLCILRNAQRLEGRTAYWELQERLRKEREEEEKSQKTTLTTKNS